MAIRQDLVDDHGFTARYASVRRFVLTLRGGTPVEARVVITTAPGEEGQTDYGEGPMVRDPNTAKYRRVRLFVFTLGYSRKSVRLLTWRSSAQIWAELHERAFRRLGGTVTVIVLDNLGEGVLTPDIYDPALNPLYRDVLAHDGVVALPCRVGDPDRNGKVEAGVGHAQKTPLKRRLPMNLVELDYALRKLRVSGMAAVLETRLRPAQTDKVTPLDLVSTLVSDELLRRHDRLLEGQLIRRIGCADEVAARDRFRRRALFVAAPGVGRPEGQGAGEGRRPVQQNGQVTFTSETGS